MSANPRRNRSARRCAVLAAVWALSGAAVAASAILEDPPAGLRVGRLILAPYWQYSYRYDDNIFRRNDLDNPVSDRVQIATAALVATLPIRNSALAFDYKVEKLSYDVSSFARDQTREAGTEFQFKFSTSDVLTARGRFTEGLTDVQSFDAGGELVFSGEPYDYNRFDLELSRTEVGQRGYTLSVKRYDLEFQGDDPVPYFDYAGTETAAEYRHPIAGRRWLLGYFQRRDFDHFEANDPSASDVPFRTERSVTLQVGLSGWLADSSPYYIRVGYGDTRMEGGGGGEYQGPIGEANLQMRVGPRSRLQMALSRFVSPSTYETYYVNDSVRLEFDREWFRYSRAAVEMQYSRNHYGDVLTVDGVPLQDCPPVIRNDRRLRVEGRFDWLVHSLFGFRVGIARENRDSNCPLSAYDVDEAFLGIRLGWF